MPPPPTSEVAQLPCSKLAYKASGSVGARSRNVLSPRE